MDILRADIGRRVMHVRPSTMDRLRGSEIDSIIVAPSFEERATSVAQNLSDHFRGCGRAILYRGMSEDSIRQRTQRDLLELCQGRAIEVDDDDFGAVLRQLHEHIRELRVWKPFPTLVVDYSCMPKTVYLAILLAASYFECRVVFSYDIGIRDMDGWTGKEGTEVKEVVTLSGFEGLSVVSGSAFLFGLGYDGHMAFAVEEMLQPRDLFGLVASPGAEESSTQIAKERNADVIAQCSGITELAIDDVCGVVGMGRDLVGLRGSLVVVPMGPKPHALGLGILALADRERVSYLRVVRKRRSTKRQVKKAGLFVVTEIDFRPRAKILT